MINSSVSPEVLKLVIETIKSETYELLLYINDVDMNKTVAAADFEEPTGAWYSRRTLSPERWATPITVNETSASLVLPDNDWLEWTNNTNEPVGPIKGYALVATSSNLLCYACKYAENDQLMINGYSTYRLRPGLFFSLDA